MINRTLTTDLGLLVLRVPAGLLMMGHGAQKLFGWFGGPGPEGTAKQLESLGYPRPKHMAMLSGATEMSAGAGIAGGVLTPLAAAGVIGVMTNATMAVHREAGPWAQRGGYEYPVVLAALATGLATHGPGKLSADAAIGLDRTGIGWGLGAVGLGLGAAVAVLRTRRTDPDRMAESPEPEPGDAAS